MKTHLKSISHHPCPCRGRLRLLTVLTWVGVLGTGILLLNFLLTLFA